MTEIKAGQKYRLLDVYAMDLMVCSDYTRGDVVTIEEVSPNSKGGLWDNGTYYLTKDWIEKGYAELVEDVSDNPQTNDLVNSPSHYMLLPGVEVKDVRKAILDNCPEGIPYTQIDDWSRAWEYLTRMWGKNGLEDAKKAKVYLAWLIEKMEEEDD